MSNNDKKWLIVSSLGATLVVATALGFAAGYYLDEWLGTAPLFTLLMFFIGVLAGIWGVVKEVMRLRK